MRCQAYLRLQVDVALLTGQKSGEKEHERLFGGSFRDKIRVPLAILVVMYSSTSIRFSRDTSHGEQTPPSFREHFLSLLRYP
jgi:hypothetical protein